MKIKQRTQVSIVTHEVTLLRVQDGPGWETPDCPADAVTRKERLTELSPADGLLAEPEPGREGDKNET